MKYDYETPPLLLKEIIKELKLENVDFMDFCATKTNTKFKDYFTKKQNFLNMHDCTRNGFCNPPFDKLYEFVSHCSNLHNKYNTTILMLLPCYTDSAWFQKFVGDHFQHVSDFRFVRKRLGFYYKNKLIKSGRYRMPCVWILWRSL